MIGLEDFIHQHGYLLLNFGYRQQRWLHTSLTEIHCAGKMHPTVPQQQNPEPLVQKHCPLMSPVPPSNKLAPTSVQDLKKRVAALREEVENRPVLLWTPYLLIYLPMSIRTGFYSLLRGPEGRICVLCQHLGNWSTKATLFSHPSTSIAVDVGRILIKRRIHYTLIQVNGRCSKVKPDLSPVPTVVVSVSNYFWLIWLFDTCCPRIVSSIPKTCKGPVMIAFAWAFLPDESHERRRRNWKRGWIVSDFYADHYLSRGHGWSCQHRTPDEGHKRTCCDDGYH